MGPTGLQGLQGRQNSRVWSDIRRVQRKVQDEERDPVRFKEWDWPSSFK